VGSALGADWGQKPSRLTVGRHGRRWEISIDNLDIQSARTEAIASGCDKSPRQQFGGVVVFLVSAVTPGSDRIEGLGGNGVADLF
jgi:hypothetical protein